jgi:hypothetical protein
MEPELEDDLRFKSTQRVVDAFDNRGHLLGLALLFLETVSPRDGSGLVANLCERINIELGRPPNTAQENER